LNTGFPILSLLGDFDLSNVGALKASFESLDSAPVLIVSLEQTDFIVSSILGALLRQHQKRHGRLVVAVRETSQIYRLFKITELLTHFPVVTTRAEALQHAVSLRESAPSLPDDEMQEAV